MVVMTIGSLLSWQKQNILAEAGDVTETSRCVDFGVRK